MSASHNVARFLDQQAKDQPDFPALKIPQRNRQGQLDYTTYTFAELNDLVARQGLALRKKGIVQGERTLLLVKPGRDLIVTVFALFKLGAIPLVIDPGMGLGAFLRCVRQARPSAVVAIPAGTILSRLFFRSFRSVRHRFTVREKKLDQLPTGSLAAVDCAENDPAAILFTSGSTGPAKGVLYTHGIFDAQVRLIRDTYNIQPGEMDLPMLPVFALFNPALGMTTVVPEINPSRPATVDPAKIIEALKTNPISNSFGSPVLWQKMTAYLERRGETLPGQRRILMAGAPVPPGLHERLAKVMPGVSTHTPYGATEALPVSSIDGPTILRETAELSRKGKGTCVGHPVPGVTVRVIGLVDGPIGQWSEVQPTATGEFGEIVVSGPMVTPSYDALPEATAKAKIRDKKNLWHRMGDVGYLDDQGRLWFCGRVVERVVTKEGTLYPDCVEGLFRDLPGVNRTALIGLGTPGNQTPALVVEPMEWPRSADEKKALLDRVKARAAEQPESQAIKEFFLLRALPVDVRHNAKIHRLSLARQYRGKRGD